MFVLLTLGSVLVWSKLRREQQDAGLRVAELITSRVQELVVLRTMDALDGFAGLIDLSGSNGEANALRSEAERLLEVPGIAALACPHPDPAEPDIVMGDEEAKTILAGEHLPPSAVAARVVPPRTSWFTPVAYENAQSAPALLLQSEAGAVRALFSPNLLIRQLIADDSLGYDLRLVTEQDTRDRSPAPLTGAAHQVEFQSPLDPESTWRLEASPLPRLGLVTLPTLVLLLGLAVSVCLALAIWFAQLANHWARELLVDNRQLRVGGELLSGENRELTEAVHDRTKELEAVVEDLETFNYSVSHDLRSPLGAILNYSSLLEEDYGEVLEEEGRSFLDRMRKNAELVVSMMDSLLTYTRVGRREMELAEIDLGEVTRAAWSETISSEDRGRVNFSVGALGTVLGDASLLRVGIGCMLDNAVKFSRDVEQPEVEVRAERDGEMVNLIIRDNGIGFACEDAESLFQVLERGRMASEYGGHGVGLAVVTRVAQRHRGSVRAEAVLGKSSTFVLSIPSASGVHV